MDKQNRYREIVQAILLPLVDRNCGGIDLGNEAIFDEKNDRYVIMSPGWHGGDVRRIHHPLIHLDIIGGKVWIRRDGTEDGIAHDLEAAGIPKSDIVLAFHPANIRPYTGYAVT